MPRFVSGLLLGAVLLSAAAPSMAQDNPFVPSNSASKADMARMEARMKALESRAAAAPAASAGGKGVPGAPMATTGAPGSPIPGTAAAMGGTPLAPGAIAAYGSPAGAGVDPILTTQSQRYGLSVDHVKEVVPGINNPVFIRQQANDVRFIGCINGVPKFVSKSAGQAGQRVVFSAHDISEAQKAGVLPTCR